MIRDQSGILVSERRSAALNKTGVSFGNHVYLQDWLKDPIPPTRYYDDEQYRSKNKGNEQGYSALEKMVYYPKMGVVYTLASGILLVVGSSFLTAAAVKKVNRSVMNLF